jgi:RHS repeat-associated protein
MATDATGAVVWSARYLPFGGIDEVLVLTGALPDGTALRFPGQWFQPETGLHQNWMRDYDPTTGRYLQADPLGLVDGASVYGYARQSPITYTDPTGLSALGDSAIGLRSYAVGLGRAGRAIARFNGLMGYDEAIKIRIELQLLATLIREILNDPVAKKCLTDTALKYINEHPYQLAGRFSPNIAFTGAALYTRNVPLGLLGYTLQAGALIGDVTYLAEYGQLGPLDLLDSLATGGAGANFGEMDCECQERLKEIQKKFNKIKEFVESHV